MVHTLGTTCWPPNIHLLARDECWSTWKKHLSNSCKPLEPTAAHGSPIWPAPPGCFLWKAVTSYTLALQARDAPVSVPFLRLSYLSYPNWSRSLATRNISKHSLPFGSWWPIVMRRCCVSRPAPCTNALCQITKHANRQSQHETSWNVNLLHCVRFSVGWRNQWHNGIKGPRQSSSLVSVPHVLSCFVVSLH